MYRPEQFTSGIQSVLAPDAPVVIAPDRPQEARDQARPQVGVLGRDGVHNPDAGGVSFVSVGGGSPLAGPLVTPNGPE